MLNLFMGDATELPFEDNSFDYVTIGFGLKKCARLFSRVNRNE